MDDVIEEKEESDDSAIGTAKRSPPNIRVPRQRKPGSQCLTFNMELDSDVAVRCVLIQILLQYYLFDWLPVWSIWQIILNRKFLILCKNPFRIVL